MTKKVDNSPLPYSVDRCDKATNQVTASKTRLFTGPITLCFIHRETHHVPVPSPSPIHVSCIAVGLTKDLCDHGRISAMFLYDQLYVAIVQDTIAMQAEFLDG